MTISGTSRLYAKAKDELTGSAEEVPTIFTEITIVSDSSTSPLPSF